MHPSQIRLCRPTRRASAVSTCAVIALCSIGPAQAFDFFVDTDTGQFGTAIGDSFHYGTPFTIDTSGDVTTWTFLGDFVLQDGDTITARGSKAAVFKALNNVVIGDNVVFNASASGSIPGAGGSGGGAGAGGSGGLDGLGGFSGGGGSGGGGGLAFCDAGLCITRDGSDGGSGSVFLSSGSSGFIGVSGRPGGDGGAGVNGGLGGVGGTGGAGGRGGNGGAGGAPRVMAAAVATRASSWRPVTVPTVALARSAHRAATATLAAAAELAAAGSTPASASR